jgi:hypothetical protein
VSTEIAVRAATLPEKMQYAEALAYSFMLPEQYRKQPANVLWAIEYGETIGITAMAAITGVHMIEGRPTASAALISGLVRRAGHRLRSGYDAATRTGWAEIVRADDPDFTFRSEWNLDRAIEAELVQVGPNGDLIARDSKGRSKPWKKFYPSMTKARAITEVARDACEEVLFGLHYTPEELGADTDDEGNVVARAARAAWTAQQDDPWQTPAVGVEHTIDPNLGSEVAPEAAEYAEVVEDRPPAATPEQVTSVLAALKAQGVNDREKARAIISEKADREISGPADLTAAEADRVVELLTAPLAEPVQQAATPEEPHQYKLRMIDSLLKKKQHTKDGGTALMTQVFGRQITSAEQLTDEEADAFIRLLDTGELPKPSGPAPVDQLADEMRAAQTSAELADVAERMWRLHEAGQLTQADVSKLQDVSLARESELTQMAGV